jgi:hypothetical protein
MRWDGNVASLLEEHRYIFGIGVEVCRKETILKIKV